MRSASKTEVELKIETKIKLEINVQMTQKPNLWITCKILKMQAHTFVRNNDEPKVNATNYVNSTHKCKLEWKTMFIDNHTAEETS